MKNVLVVVVLTLVSSACSSHETDQRPAASQLASTPAAAGGGDKTVSRHSSVSKQLMHDVQSSPQLYDIGASHGDGLGHYTLRFAGKPVWPPHGARCSELERCCNELANVADSLALVCLLATARDQNCRLARKTTSEIALEQGHRVPASCTP